MTSLGGLVRTGKLESVRRKGVGRKRKRSSVVISIRSSRRHSGS
jgi:hypothetical protein